MKLQSEAKISEKTLGSDGLAWVAILIATSWLTLIYKITMLILSRHVCKIRRLPSHPDGRATSTVDFIPDMEILEEVDELQGTYGLPATNM